MKVNNKLLFLMYKLSIKLFGRNSKITYFFLCKWLDN